MALIANLDIALRGQTGNLDASLDQSANNLSRFKSRVDQQAGQVNQRLASMGQGSGMSSLSGVTGLLGGALGGLATVAMAAAAAVIGVATAAVYLASRQSEVIASTQRMAMTLDMSTEAFSAWSSQGGMDVETFAHGMNHFQRVLAETTLNGGAMAASLARVGLTARDLQNATPEDALRRIAIAMQGMNNQADRLRLSQELFGRGAGFDMTRVLQNGVAGLDELTARAQRFGTTFSESEAETVRQSNRTWGEWKSALSGIGNTLAVSFAPIWSSIGRGLSNFFVNLGNWVRSITPYITQMWEAFQRGLEYVQPVFTWIGNAFDAIKGYASRLYDTVVPILQRVWDNFKRGASAVWEVAKSVWEVVLEVKQTLQPFWEFIVSGWNTVYTLVSESMAFAVPLLQQSWNIVCAIFSSAWDMISSICSTAIAFIRPIVEGFANFFSGIFDSMGITLGTFTQAWETFKNFVLRVLITLEFAIRNWRAIISLSWDMVKLKFFELVQALQPVIQGFQSFINFMIDGFNVLTRALSRIIERSINGLINGYNRLARRLGLAQIGLVVTVDMGQLDNVNLTLENMGDTIQQLRTRIAQQQGELSQDLAAFINQRLNQLTATQAQVQAAITNQAQNATNAIQRQRGQINQDRDFKENKAAEKGSVEAYAIIAGDKGDRQFQALNDIVREMQIANGLNRQELNELRGRFNIAVARL